MNDKSEKKIVKEGEDWDCSTIAVGIQDGETTTIVTIEGVPRCTGVEGFTVKDGVYTANNTDFLFQSSGRGKQKNDEKFFKRYNSFYGWIFSIVLFCLLVAIYLPYCFIIGRKSNFNAESRGILLLQQYENLLGLFQILTTTLPAYRTLQQNQTLSSNGMLGESVTLEKVGYMMHQLSVEDQTLKEDMNVVSNWVLISTSVAFFFTLCLLAVLVYFRKHKVFKTRGKVFLPAIVISIILCYTA
eukprot:Awhi_evm1s6761